MFRLNQSKICFDEDTVRPLRGIKPYNSICIDCQGNLIEFKISMDMGLEANLSCERDGRRMTIVLPCRLVPYHLYESNNKFQRLIISSDNRVLICGKVIIQFNFSMTKI